MSFPNFSNRYGSRTFGNRTVYDDERNCLNCTYQSNCWPGQTEGAPPGFQLRASWNRLDFQPYIKNIFGSICDAFRHTDQQINAAMRQAEIKRLQETAGEKEWED